MNLDEISKECQAIESQLEPEVLSQHLANISYWQLNQKILQTLYYKKPFEEISDFKKLRGNCISNCYDKVTDQELKDMSNPLISDSVVRNLQTCVTACELPCKDVETYIDNIDFLALQKLDGCSKSCTTL